jgi:hypothetical protein
VLRYEDFIQEPRAALLRVTSLAGEGPVDLPLRSEREALLVANHTVSGNPSRFTRGSVELRPDNEWVARQSRRDRIVSTSLALPWLRRYGYPIRVA